MNVVLTLVLVLIGFLLASLASAYSYGRFARRAIGEPSHALPISSPATPLDEVAAPLLERHPNASGLTLLADNLDAFALRALTARQARRSLDLQYYIWANDLTGRLLTHEVVEAADRGVRVRLLLDDINAQGYDRAYLALACHPQISVRLFNPSRNRDGVFRRGVEMLLRAFWVNRRMHNKSWIADGRLAVVGGRNIGDAYFDAAEISNFRDLDLLLLGPTVRQAETIFDQYWNSEAVIPITALGKKSHEELRVLRRELTNLADGERAKPYLQRVAESESVRQMVSGNAKIYWTSNAQVVSDPPMKAAAADHDWLMAAIIPVLGTATTDLKIISPYFIPGRRGARTLVAMKRKGIRVSVLTNSLAATDVAAVHGAYARYRRPLVEGGVNLFELKPYEYGRRMSLFGSSSASLHTKAFTVDNRVGFVGSMNFDPRSLSLNTEMGVLFEHHDLVTEMCSKFADETSPQKSYRLALENGTIKWRGTVAGVIRVLDREPDASLERRMTATLVRLLPIESQL